MLICMRCKSVFGEADQDERVIDRPCGEYGGYPKPVCPCCGDPEIIEAFECSECGGWFPIDERQYHPFTELDICDDCWVGVNRIGEDRDG